MELNHKCPLPSWDRQRCPYWFNDELKQWPTLTDPQRWVLILRWVWAWLHYPYVLSTKSSWLRSSSAIDPSWKITIITFMARFDSHDRENLCRLAPKNQSRRWEIGLSDRELIPGNIPTVSRFRQQGFENNPRKSDSYVFMNKMHKSPTIVASFSSLLPPPKANTYDDQAGYSFGSVASTSLTLRKTMRQDARPPYPRNASNNESRRQIQHHCA